MIYIYTYQDFEKDVASEGVCLAVSTLITNHRTSPEFLNALTADAYDRQQNETIMSFVKWLYDSNGTKYVDFTASNNRICSNFFRRLLTQKVTYSLGNGITFEDKTIKDKLGLSFDAKFKKAAYKACSHGVSFIYWNLDHIHVYAITEFAPLWDEDTGALMGGVRWWQIDPEKPVMAVLYLQDGYTKFKGSKTGTSFEIIQNQTSYKQTIMTEGSSQEPEIIGEENWPTVPIVPLYGSELKQSAILSMRGSIDAYDLVKSGFANDLEECAQIYWLLGNAGGMTDGDMDQFRDRLKLKHVATVANADEVTITPYSQDVPYQARKTFLDDTRASIYENFGAFDVKGVSSNATATEINASYQPMDENADDFEYQIIECIQQLLALTGISDDATPLFKRNRIANLKEQTDMVLECANLIGDEATIKKIPWLTPEEIEEILKEREDSQLESFGFGKDEPDDDSDDESDETDEDETDSDEESDESDDSTDTKTKKKKKDDEEDDD